MKSRSTELTQQSLLGSSVLALLTEITRTVTMYVLKIFRSFSDGSLSYPSVKSSIRSGVSNRIRSSRAATSVGSANNTAIVSRCSFASVHSIILTSLLLCTWSLQSTLAINPGTFSRNVAAMAALTEDGKMYSWGAKTFGGGPQLMTHKVRSVYSTQAAFTLITEEGLVASWGLSSGHLDYGGKKPTSLLRAQAIFSTERAFAALTEEGTVVAWGDSNYGGTAPSGLTNVRTIFSNVYAFAALKKDGTVVAWGDSTYGGSMSDGRFHAGVPANLANVKIIYPNYYAFAALKEDGTVQAWGYRQWGGAGVPANLTNVIGIYASGNAFAALRKDGTVRAWGSGATGGTDVPTDLSHVTAIYSTLFAFCAHLSDGRVRVWGSPGDGGTQPSNLDVVSYISSTSRAFAALTEHGTVVAWGNPIYGGGMTDVTIDGVLYTGVPAGMTNVRALYSSYGAFAALLEDDTVQAWGDSRDGGKLTSSSDVRGVQSIFSSDSAFAALKADGTIFAWGNPAFGGSMTDGQDATLGNYTGVPSGLKNVKTIFGDTRCYADSTAAQLLPCPHNTYGPGFPNCTACPQGSEQPVGRPGIRSKVWSCIDCDIEKNGAEKFSMDGKTCDLSCADGYQVIPYNWYGSVTRLEGDMCFTCLPGSYFSDNDCKLCPLGRYQDTKGQHSCKECPTGKYTRAGEGSIKCSACPGSKTVLPGRGYAASDCFKICPKGQYGSTNSNTCLPCKAGTYNNLTSGTNVCTPCEAGKAQPLTNQTSCSLCAAGKWANIHGATECFECPPGSSCSKRGMSNPEPCPVGRYTDVKIKVNCSACPAGRYQHSTGSAKCLFCDAGKYNPVRGSNSTSACKECSPGRFSSREGATACQACGKDTYSNSTMQSRAACVPCERGKSTEGEGPNGNGLAATKCVDVESACDPGRTRRGGLCYGCPPGTFSADGLLCLACSPGTYSEAWNSSICSKCPAGRYGVVEAGSSLKSACRPCMKGRYVSTLGSLTCIECPPGSSCSRKGMNDSEPCPVGRYADTKMQQNCSACPAGCYQSDIGSAKCSLCPRGKYLSALFSLSNGGANSSASCLLCPAGTYGDKEGLGECTRCPTGQVQPSEGQFSCSDCSLVSKIKTNNAEHTACIDNPALLSTSAVELMFNKGVALSISFTIAVVFLGLAVAMHHMKKKYSAEANEEALAGLKMLQVALKSVLPGFSFGSEMVLIGGMMTEDQGFGGTMLAFRMLHPLTIIVLTCILFITNDANLPERLRNMVRMSRLNEKFVRKNVAPVGLLVLASGCDVTMLQLMPWEQSRFYEESMGYPCFDLMIVCMVVKTLQSLVSVICQIGYLWKNSDLSDPTMSIQAKILFSLSITLSTVTLIMGVMVLTLKWALLRKVADKSEEEMEEEMERSPEIGDLYATNDEEGAVDSIQRVENPMHSAAMATIAELREKNSKLEEELQKYHFKVENCSTEDQVVESEFSSVPQQQVLAMPSTERSIVHARLVNFGKISGKRNSLENVNQETPKASASETISSSDSSKNNEKVNVTCTDDNL